MILADLHTIHQITVNHTIYTRAEVCNPDWEIPVGEYYPELFGFLKEWWSDSPTMTVQTSGSTGRPKPMEVEKQRMVESARTTCRYLRLSRGDTALLCMSLDYIAGKMMVVRALVCGLNIISTTPCGHPLKECTERIDFAAMVPLQVVNSLSVLEEAGCFEQIKKVIIGGSSINEQLASDLQQLSNAVYSSYGMTETLSHIALRRINGADASKSYFPLSQVEVSLSDEGTLVIDAPHICPVRLTTHDMAEIHADGSFDILGRKDHVINSGGLKIQIEEVERILTPVIRGDFAVTSAPDERFGEALVLVVTNPFEESQIAKVLPTYYFPKQILQIDSLPRLENAKLDRLSLKRIAKENYRG